MTLADLPEELINRVALFLKDQTALAAIALASRKLNRIVTPHLYTAVSLVISKSGKKIPYIIEDTSFDSDTPTESEKGFFDLPTTAKCNTFAFVKTIKRRPDLGPYVKSLELIRNDQGYRLRKTLGYYDGKDLEQLSAGAPIQIDLEMILSARSTPRTNSMDPAHEVVPTLLRMLPHVTLLDCGKYCTDVPRNPILSLVGSLATLQDLQHDFSQLRSLVFNSDTTHVSKLWPIFTLPCLRTLSLTSVHLHPLLASEYDLDQWKPMVRSSAIQELILLSIRVLTCWPSSHDFMPLRLMFDACQHIKLLTLTMASDTIENVLNTCQRQLSTAISLDLGGTSPTPVGVGLLLARERMRRPYASDTVSMVRNSQCLEELSIDVAMLLNLELATQTTKDTSERLRLPHIIVKELSNQELASRIDMTLPQSLKTLNLKVSNETNLQTELLAVLEDMSQNLQTPFPGLEKLGIAWEIGGLVTEEAGKNYLSADLLETFRLQGVQVVQSLIG